MFMDQLRYENDQQICKGFYSSLIVSFPIWCGAEKFNIYLTSGILLLQLNRLTPVTMNPTFRVGYERLPLGI